MTAVATAPARARAQLAGYYAALAGIGLSAAVLGPTLPSLAAQTGTTLSQISALFVARSVGYLAGSVLVGRLYDRWPGHPLMALAILVTAVSLSLVPLAPWLWLLTLVMVFLGVAEAATDVGSNTLIVWTYGERVAPYMNGLHFAFGVGAFISPLLVAQAIQWSGGISWAFWALAALVLPPLLWLPRLPSPPVQASTTQAQTGQTRLVLVALFVTCFFFYVGSEISFGAWAYTYASRMGLADETTAAYLTSVFWGALTLGRLLSVPIATRVRPRTILAVSFFGCVVSVGVALAWPAAAWAAWVSAFGTGLSMAAIFPTLMALAGRRLALTGQITSLFFIGGSLGGTFLPWLIGQLIEPVGPRIVMILIFAGVVLDVLAFVALIVLAPQPQSGAQGVKA